MEIKTFELSGYVGIKHEDGGKDVYLVPKDKLPEKDEDGDFERWWYPDGDSIGEAFMNHFKELCKPFDISPTDWTKGDYLEYQGVFCRMFVSDDEKSWDEVNELHIKKLAGAIVAQDELTGYSEYTVTASWTELFVGGHDLRAELMEHEGKFVRIKVDYKV